MQLCLRPIGHQGKESKHAATNKIIDSGTFGIEQKRLN
jgi:hypothetical protein